MSTKCTVIRFGILGFGNHAERVFLPALGSLRCGKIVATATRQPQRVDFLRSHLAGAAIFDSYEEVISQKLIDAVYIALPNHLHTLWSNRALMSGIHVLCEKPISLDAASDTTLVESQRSSGCILHEGFAYRFHPQHQLAHDLLKSGAIGDLRAIDAQYSYFLDDENNIRLRADCAGGALNDAGCYLIDLFKWYAGDNFESISAKASFFQGIDSSTQIEIATKQGVFGSLYCSCRDKRANYYKLIGARGSITVTAAFHTPRGMKPVVVLQQKDQRDRKFTVEKHNQFESLILNFCEKINGNDANKECITPSGNILEKLRRELM